jgi:hypothetical protein
MLDQLEVEYQSKLNDATRNEDILKSNLNEVQTVLDQTLK